MKRIAIVALLSLAPIVAVLAAVFGERGLPAEARRALDRYRWAQQAASGVAWVVAQTEPAGRPWNLTPALSARVLGDSARFEVDRELDASGAQAALTGQTYFAQSRRSLPYPASTVWCALLRPADAATRPASAERLVLVARHQDLYNGGWLIHEVRPSPAVVLEAVGCSPMGRQ